MHWLQLHLLVNREQPRGKGDKRRILGFRGGGPGVGETQLSSVYIVDGRGGPRVGIQGGKGKRPRAPVQETMGKKSAPISFS